MDLGNKLKASFKEIERHWDAGYHQQTSTEVALQAYQELQSYRNCISGNYAAIMLIMAQNAMQFPFLHSEDEFVRINAEMQMEHTFKKIRDTLRKSWMSLAFYFAESLESRALIQPIANYADIQDDQLLLQISDHYCQLLLINGSASAFGIPGMPKHARNRYALAFDNDENPKMLEKFPPVRDIADTISYVRKDQGLYVAEKLRHLLPAVGSRS